MGGQKSKFVEVEENGNDKLSDSADTSTDINSSNRSTRSSTSGSSKSSEEEGEKEEGPCLLLLSFLPATVSALTRKPDIMTPSPEEYDCSRHRHRASSVITAHNAASLALPKPHILTPSSTPTIHKHKRTDTGDTDACSDSEHAHSAALHTAHSNAAAHTASRDRTATLLQQKACFGWGLVSSFIPPASQPIFTLLEEDHQQLSQQQQQQQQHPGLLVHELHHIGRDNDGPQKPKKFGHRRGGGLSPCPPQIQQQPTQHDNAHGTHAEDTVATRLCLANDTCGVDLVSQSAADSLSNCGSVIDMNEITQFTLQACGVDSYQQPTSNDSTSWTFSQPQPTNQTPTIDTSQWDEAYHQNTFNAYRKEEPQLASSISPKQKHHNHDSQNPAQSDHLLSSAPQTPNNQQQPTPKIEDVRFTIHRQFSLAQHYESNAQLSLALQYYQSCLSMHLSKDKQQQKQQHPPSFTLLDKAHLLQRIGIVHWKSGAYDTSLRILTEALAIFQNTLTITKTNTFVHDTADNSDTIKSGMKGNYDADSMADILNTIGRVHLSRGNYDQAMKHYQKSLSVQTSVYAEINEDNGDDFINHAAHKLNLPEAQKLSERKRKIRQRLRQQQAVDTHPSTARTYIYIGMVHEAQGKFVRAMRHYQKGLASQRASLGDEHVDVAATLNSIGSLHDKCGEYDLAMASYTEALLAYRKQLGNDHADVAVTLNSMGQVHYQRKDYDEATKAFNEALRIMRKALGDDHRNVAATLHNFGLVQTARGQYDMALKTLKDTLNRQRAALGDDHLDVALTLDSIGAAYEGKKNKMDRSAKFYARALRVRRNVLGKKHIFVAITLDRLGRFHMDRDGNLLEALRRFDEAKNLYVSSTNQLPNDHERVRDVTRAMEEIRLKLKNISDDKDTKSTTASTAKTEGTTTVSTPDRAIVASDDLIPMATRAMITTRRQVQDPGFVLHSSSQTSSPFRTVSVVVNDNFVR